MEKQKQNPPAAPAPEKESKGDTGANTKANSRQGQAKIMMEWVTLAYRQTEKSFSWYAVMGLIVLVFVIYNLFADKYGWIVSITFLIMAGVYYLSELKKAPTVLVSISDHGVRFGARYFAYNEIKSFWIYTEENVRNLHLTLYKGGDRDIGIMIDDEINIAKLREYLLSQIPEEEGRKETFSDHLIRNLGL